MSSVLKSTKQLPFEGGNFVVLPGASANNGVLAYAPNTADVNSPGSFTKIVPAASYAAETPVALTRTTLGSISTTGAVLRDMGKTVVSSGLTFRKVQYVAPSLGTGGVAGPADTTVSGYYTFYIQLGLNGGTTYLPVARV